MHYDNPDMEEGEYNIIIPYFVKVIFFFYHTTGVFDSSGMRFFYTSTRRQHDAGMVGLGHYVTPDMLIPPGAINYTISGLCTSTCTKKVVVTHDKPTRQIHLFYAAVPARRWNPRICNFSSYSPRRLVASD